MRFRKLRISWSVFWDMVALVLGVPEGGWVIDALQAVSGIVMLALGAWLPFRFRLLDLLVVTTLLAVALGAFLCAVSPTP